MTADMFATLEQVTRLVEEDNPDEAYRVMKDAVAQDSHGFARIFLSEWMKHLETEDENVQNKFAEILIFLKEDFPELASLAESKTVEQEVAVAAPLAMPVWLAPFAKPEPAAVPEPVAERPAEPAVPSFVEQSAEEPVAAPEPLSSAEPEVATLEPLVKAAEPEQAPVEEKPQTVQKVKAPEPEEREHLTLTFYEWQMSAIAKAAQREHVDEGVLLARMLETRKMEPLMWSRFRHGKTSSPAHRITIAVPHKTKVTLEKDKDFEGIKTTTKYVRKVLFGNRAEKS